LALYAAGFNPTGESYRVYQSFLIQEDKTAHYELEYKAFDGVNLYFQGWLTDKDPKDHLPGA
jgi:hypothetical protein